jgi:DNA-binding NarL/FixJ family response regulator
MSGVMEEPGRPTAIAIVEDDDILRSCLGEMVGQIPGCRVKAEAGTLTDGLALLEHNLDVLLVDLALPDGSGLEIVTKARATGNPVRVMVLTVFADVTNVVNAIVEGADGYLLKESPLEEIAAALRTLMSGGAPISPAIAGHILGRVRSQGRRAAAAATPTAGQRGPRAAPALALTGRETAVLEALSLGKSFKEVAAAQGISPHTVGDHVKAIYRKLSVNSRGEAVYKAVQSGLIRLQR